MDNNKSLTTFLPPTEILTMGKAFVESGMFPDIKTAAQAVVKIQAGQEIGIAPFAAMTGIHIIQGKPTIGAGIIASRVKASGKYDYRVVQQTDAACSIDFYQGKDKIGNSTFTIEDARKAGTKNLDKFPKNMLFARAISNGVKWFCPDVFSGPVYTPEEMVDITPEEVTTASSEQKNGKAVKRIEEPKPEEKKEDDDALFLWKEELSKVHTKPELVKLYMSNRAIIDSDERLKKLFKEKENEFSKGVAHV